MRASLTTSSVSLPAEDADVAAAVVPALFATACVAVAVMFVMTVFGAASVPAVALDATL